MGHQVDGRSLKIIQAVCSGVLPPLGDSQQRSTQQLWEFLDVISVVSELWTCSVFLAHSSQLCSGPGLPHQIGGQEQHGAGGLEEMLPGYPGVLLKCLISRGFVEFYKMTDVYLSQCESS